MPRPEEPEELHARLSAAAKRHRRSLNQEAIVCLERAAKSEIPEAEKAREALSKMSRTGRSL